MYFSFSTDIERHVAHFLQNRQSVWAVATQLLASQVGVNQRKQNPFLQQQTQELKASSLLHLMRPLEG